MSQRRAPSTGSSAISSPSTSRSWTSCHTVSSKTARSIRASRYCGSLPAVSLSPNCVGRKGWQSRMTGLDAASMCRRTSSPPSTGAPTRTHWLRGLRPFTGSAVGPVDEALALEARHVRRRSRGRGSPRRSGRPTPAGTVPVTVNQLVPQGAPHGVARPRSARVGAASPSATGTGSPGACPDRDVQRYRFRVHGGPDALVEDALEAGFDQAAVVMHEGKLLEGQRDAGVRGAGAGAGRRCNPLRPYALRNGLRPPLCDFLRLSIGFCSRARRSVPAGTDRVPAIDTQRDQVIYSLYESQ